VSGLTESLVVKNSKRGVCRIIAGKWRGRKIRFNEAEGLRPTTDRIRETVFNWLQAYISHSHCLDCFAGSGVLGFEALSRGADEVVFIEQNIKAVNALKDNIGLLEASNTAVYHEDALVWLQSASTNTGLKQHFDLVFLDPPFHSALLSRSCHLLNSSGCLAEDAIIYTEHAVDATVDFPEHWFCLKQKSSGQVSYKLFEKRG
jgi:16S rRNA (guanine966-N2)-methyltransferase